MDTVRIPGRLVALGVVGALAIGACSERTGGPPARLITTTANGVTAEFPAGWTRAGTSLTPALRDPREVLAAATFPLRYHRTACAHVAGSALEDLGPRDAFVTLQERGFDPASTWPDFPPRPAHFGPELGGPSEAAECVPSARFTDHWFGFSDGDRHFHVEVAFGPQTPVATRDEAWAVLDSLRVDPHVRPDWPSSG